MSASKSMRNKVSKAKIKTSSQDRVYPGLQAMGLYSKRKSKRVCSPLTMPNDSLAHTAPCCWKREVLVVCPRAAAVALLHRDLCSPTEAWCPLAGSAHFRNFQKAVVTCIHLDYSGGGGYPN